MRIFSYVFYTLSKVYRAGLAKSTPDIYACGALSGLQMFNVVAILEIFFTLTKEQLMLYGGGISLAILVTNMILFNSKSLRKFNGRWDNEPKAQRFFRRFLVLIYVAATAAGVVYVVS